jgi:hypothetical protein
MRGRGGFIGANVTPEASNGNSAAAGVWTLREAESLKRAGTWPFSTTDSSFASVSSFLDFNAANGATTFTDGLGVTWTAEGNAQISTSSPYEGTGSLLLDGNGDSINAVDDKLAVGTGDFTIEAWVYADSVPSRYQGLVTTHDDAGSGTGRFFLTINNSNRLEVQGTGYGATWPSQSSILFPAQTWTHVAMSRVSGSIRLFQGGQLVSGPVTGTQNLSRNICSIGRTYTNLSANYFAGKIDLFRVTKGVGRYTATFTPTAYIWP